MPEQLRGRPMRLRVLAAVVRQMVRGFKAHIC
jgi:hypothetical protein